MSFKTDSYTVMDATYTSNIFKHIGVEKSLLDIPRLNNMYSILSRHNAGVVNLSLDSEECRSGGLINSILQGNLQEFCHILSIRDENIGSKILAEIISGTYEKRHIVKPDVTVVCGLLSEELHTLLYKSNHGGLNVLELALLCEQYEMAIYQQLLGFNVNIRYENQSTMLMKQLSLIPMSKLVGNRELVLPNVFQKGDGHISLEYIQTLKPDNYVPTRIKESTEHDLEKWLCILHVFGLDFSSVTESGETVLHLAVRLRLPSLVKLLIQRGLNVHAKNKLGDSPLWLAVKLGYAEIAQEFSKLPELETLGTVDDVELLDLVMYMYMFHLRFMDNVNESVLIKPQTLAVHSSFFIDRLVIRDLFFSPSALKEYVQELLKQTNVDCNIEAASKGKQWVMTVYIDGLLNQLDSSLSNSVAAVIPLSAPPSLSKPPLLPTTVSSSTGMANTTSVTSTLRTPLLDFHSPFIDEDRMNSRHIPGISRLSCVPAVYSMSLFTSMQLQNGKTSSSTMLTLLESGRAAILASKTHLQACLESNIANLSQAFATMSTSEKTEYKQLYSDLETHQSQLFSQPSEQANGMQAFLRNFFLNLTTTSCKRMVKSVPETTTPTSVVETVPLATVKEPAPQLARLGTSQLFNIMHPSWDDSMRQASVLTKWKGEARGSIFGGEGLVTTTPKFVESHSCPVFQKAITQSPILKRPRDRSGSLATTRGSINTASSFTYLKKPRLQSSVRSLTSLLLDPNNDPPIGKYDYPRSSTTLDLPIMLPQPFLSFQGVENTPCDQVSPLPLNQPSIQSNSQQHPVLPTSEQQQQQQQPSTENTLMDVMDINILLSCASSALRLIPADPRYTKSSEAEQIARVIESTKLFSFAHTILPTSVHDSHVLLTTNGPNGVILTYTPGKVHKNTHIALHRPLSCLVNFQDEITFTTICQCVLDIVTDKLNPQTIPRIILFHTFSFILLYLILITVHSQLMVLHMLSSSQTEKHIASVSDEAQSLALQTEADVCRALMQHETQHPIYSVLHIILTRASDGFKKTLDNILTGIEQGLDNQQLFSLFISENRA